MEIKVNLPLLPLRDIVVFPSMVIPLFVGRDKSISALNEVMKKDKKMNENSKKITSVRLTLISCVNRDADVHVHVAADLLSR